MHCVEQHINKNPSDMWTRGIGIVVVLITITGKGLLQQCVFRVQLTFKPQGLYGCGLYCKSMAGTIFIRELFSGMSN